MTILSLVQSRAITSQSILFTAVLASVFAFAYYISNLAPY